MRLLFAQNIKKKSFERWINVDEDMKKARTNIVTIFSQVFELFSHKRDNSAISSYLFAYMPLYVYIAMIYRINYAYCIRKIVRLTI
jgi:hypothetical protein